ncbi:neuropeptide FF receptor 2-like [Mercenaria mercenaria]|uniref:neuropeptide FF receptor 2-like n=1 Tax=Mercenaria mercenaria TaxID=6596 RepID=UPI00234F783B|nr:neuropeptide FF receptor 2-like [Mercenaria mercenaria]
MACEPGTEQTVSEDYDPYLVQNMTALDLPRDIPKWEIGLKVSFYLLAFLMDIVGNSIVILIVFINKRMRTTTNVLLLNLAVSDIMVGCCCMWVHAGNSITKEWPFGPNVCKVNTFMQVLAVTSSVLTLTAISVERFIAIMFPLNRRLTPVFTAIVIVTNWIISAGMASPHLVVRRQFEYFWADRHEIWCEEVWPKVIIDEECHTEMPGRTIYYTVVCVVLYFIPIFIMMCTYTLILVKLMLRKRPGTVITATKQALDRSRKKVIRMLVAILAVFIICWTPQQGFILWDIYGVKDKEIDDNVLRTKYAAVYIAYFNSALNPILYGGFNENFRKGFKDAFKCILWKRRNTIAPLLPEQDIPRNNQGSVNTTPFGTSVV